MAYIDLKKILSQPLIISLFFVKLQADYEGRIRSKGSNHYDFSKLDLIIVVTKYVRTSGSYLIY